MRLLMVTFDPPENVGGIEGRVRGYVTELRRSGDEVIIQVMTPNGRFSSGRFLGVPLYTCPSNPSEVPKALQFTRRVIRRHSIDAVFFLSGGATLFGLALLAACRLAGRRTAILFYGKDILETRLRPSGRWLLRASQGLASVVFSNSRFTGSLLTPTGRRKGRILYPSISPKFGGSPPSIEGPPESNRVLFVGRLVERKGVDDLVEAIGTLAPSYQGLRLDVVGDGPERRRLEAQVTRMGLRDRVVFYGNLVGPPLVERYRACAIFAMPSRRTKDDVEGFGTVFLEAGWFSKPSVSTRTGGIPEAVVDGSTGLLVEERNPAQLADALRKLLADESLRRRLGANARARVLEGFTWERAAAELRKSLRC